MAPKKKRKTSKSKKFIPQASIVSDELYLPNHSGTHDAGTVQKTPTADSDIVNKKYVDDNSGLFNVNIMLTLLGAVLTLNGNVLILQ